MYQNFTPINEQGVILAFAQVCAYMDFEVVAIQTTYPDVLLHDHVLNTKIRAEFEYHASNFRAHGHDPKGVDLIICWNRGRDRFDVPVLELSTLLSYPPQLHEQPPQVVHPARPKGERNHTILVTHLAHYYEREDGNEATIIVHPGGIGEGGIGLEAYKDDPRPGRAQLWEAISWAKEARKFSGKYDNTSEAARKADTSVCRILNEAWLHGELPRIRA